MKNKTGFTLIELLVVVAIIGLLSSLVVANLNNARKKARDTVRIADIRQVQSALEMYSGSNGIYPNVDNWDLMTTELSEEMPDVPTNPKPGGTEYTYKVSDNGTSYVITFTLESGAGKLSAGLCTVTLAGITCK